MAANGEKSLFDAQQAEFEKLRELNAALHDQLNKNSGEGHFFSLLFGFFNLPGHPATINAN